MQITDELIERFFKKQCTAAEARQVAKYLNANREVLDKYLSEREWNQPETGAMPPEALWQEAWAAIRARKRTARIVYWAKRSAAAACIGTLTFMLFHHSGNIKKEKPVAPAAPVIASIEHKITQNNSGRVMAIHLSDSSVVELSPGSELRYDQPFQNNKRELFLEGEAYFKVAKDKTKPFTVYAGSLATTALGTAFSINTGKGVKKQVLVKLFTGKVVIRSADAGLKGWNKGVYLMPGEQMSYNPENRLVEVGKIKDLPGNTVPLKKLPVAADKKTSATTDDGLTFNSDALPEVMDKLAAWYHVKIDYDTAAMQTMNFTGSITRSDSLEVVLKVIARMNGLEITRQPDGFTMRKSNQ